MPKVAIVKNIHPSGIKLLKNNSKFKLEVIEDYSKENLIKKLPNFDAIAIKRNAIPLFGKSIPKILMEKIIKLENSLM